MQREILLDAFEVLEPIARGGMGVVLRGRHRSLGIPVAIKVVSHRRAREERAASAFAREVRAMASLEHPHIVRILDLGVVPERTEKASPDIFVAGSPYLVMELAHGTLEQPYPARLWSRTRAVLLTLLDALAHAHARGIIHRDLKPANVLRVRQSDGSSVLKLSDFGLAHVVAERFDERGAAAGTPQMMAPEQFRGAVRDFGPWTDLYALGCLAYKLVSGAPPFDHADEDELARMHVLSPPPPLVPLFAIPDGLDRWIERLLAKSTADRFARAADAARALLALPEPHHTRERDAELELELSSALASSTHSPTTELTPEGSTGELTGSLTTLSFFTPSTHDGGVLPEIGSRERARTPTRAPLPDWRPMSVPTESLWVGAALRLWGLRDAPFVDREREREACWRSLEAVLESGRARAVILRGAAGFGKSRLAEWICERAHEVGAADPLHAIHDPLASPSEVLSRMFAAHLRTTGLSRGGVLGRARRAFPEEDSVSIEAIADVLVERLDRSAMSGSARVALQARVLALLAGQRPVIAWLDDVQWGADALALVERTLDMQSEHPSPVLFLLTVQSDALAERAVEWARLSSLAARPECIELEIGPLEPDAHALLISRLLGSGGELATRLAARTAGHPLFAVQLVGDWVERGLLLPSSEGLRLRPGAEDVLPDDLHALWRDRLEHVLAGASGHALMALELIALAGGRADPALLAAAFDAAGLEYPQDGIDRLLERHLLVLDEAGGDGITFELVHGLLRETLVRSAREEGRARRHHAVIASALWSRWRSGESSVARQLAAHLEESGDGLRSLGPLLAAARGHLDRSEYAQARALLDHHGAISDSLALPIEHPERLESTITRAEVLRRLGMLEEAAQIADAVAGIANAEGLPALAARARYVRGFADVERGLVASGIAELGRARDELELLGEMKDASRALRAIGYAHQRRLEHQLAYQAYLRALELAERAGDRLGAAAALGGAGLCDPDKRPGDPARIGEALAIFESQGNLYGVAATLNNLAEVARATGRHAEAEALYLRALAASQQVGASHLEGIVIGNLAVLQIRAGAFAEAYEELQLGLRRAQRLNQRQLITTLHLLSLAGAAGKGEWDELDWHLSEAGSSLGSLEAPDEDVAWAAERAGEIARRADEHERARAAYALAATLYRALGRADDARRCDELGQRAA